MQFADHTRKLARSRPIASALALAAALLWGPAATAQSTDAPLKVKVGGITSLLYLPFYIAIEQGYFAKQGLAPELITLANTNPALISGDVNFDLSGSEAAVIAAARGKPTPAIVMMQQRNSLSLNVSVKLPEPAVKQPYPANLQALRGKTIGINRRGAGAETFAKQVFAGAGMEEGRDFNVIVIGAPASTIVSLKAGQIDAAVLWPPFQEQAATEKAAYPLIREARGEGPENRGKAAGASVHVNPQFMKENPQLVRRFVAAMVEADAFNRDFEKNKERLLGIAMKYTGLTNKEVLAEALASQSALAYPGIDCAAWGRTAQALLEAKTITAAPKCYEMTSAEFAPKGPIGPDK